MNSFSRTLLPFVSAAILLAGCGSAGDTSAGAAGAPSAAQQSARAKGKGFWDSFFFNLGDPTWSQPDYGPEDFIRNSSGFWQGDLVVMTDACTPGTFGASVTRLLVVTIDDDDVTVVDEAGRTYLGFTDRFITFSASLAPELAPAGLSGGSVDFLWSSGTASVQIREEMPVPGGVCVNEYWGSMGRLEDLPPPAEEVAGESQP